MRRLQHSTRTLISFIVITGFLCVLHTYNITQIAKTCLPLWVCRLHCVITKVNNSFNGVTYVCVYLFIICHGPLYLFKHFSHRQGYYYLRGCRTPRRRRIGSYKLLSRWGTKGHWWSKIWDLPLGFVYLLTSWKYSSSEV